MKTVMRHSGAGCRRGTPGREMGERGLRLPGGHHSPSCLTGLRGVSGTNRARLSTVRGARTVAQAAAGEQAGITAWPWGRVPIRAGGCRAGCGRPPSGHPPNARGTTVSLAIGPGGCSFCVPCTSLTFSGPGLPLGRFLGPSWGTAAQGAFRGQDRPVGRTKGQDPP